MQHIWEYPLYMHADSHDTDYESPIHAQGEYLYYACRGASGTDFHIIHAATGESTVHHLAHTGTPLPSKYFAITHKDRVIFYCGDLLAAEGPQILQHLQLPRPVSQHLVCGSTLVVCCGQLVGIDLDTLTISWFLRLDCEKLYKTGEIAPFGDLISCYGQNQLLFVDPLSGQVVDSIRLPRIDKLYSPIALEEDSLLIGYTNWTNAGILRYDRKEQKVIWRHKRKFEGPQILCRLWRGEDCTYWVKNNTELICVDDATGVERYQLRTTPWLYTDLTLRGEDILYGTSGANGSLNCLDAKSGGMRWAVPLQNGCEFYAIHGETALVGDFSNRIMQLSLRDGAMLDQISTDGPVVGQISVHDGYVHTVIWASGDTPARLVRLRLGEPS